MSPDGAGDLPLAAVHHAGRAEPGRSPAAAPGAVSHLPSETAARRGLQTHRALQGERNRPGSKAKGTEQGAEQLIPNHGITRAAAAH